MPVAALLPPEHQAALKLVSCMCKKIYQKDSVWKKAGLFSLMPHLLNNCDSMKVICENKQEDELDFLAIEPLESIEQDKEISQGIFMIYSFLTYL